MVAASSHHGADVAGGVARADRALVLAISFSVAAGSPVSVTTSSIPAAR